MEALNLPKGKKTHSFRTAKPWITRSVAKVLSTLAAGSNSLPYSERLGLGAAGRLAGDQRSVGQCARHKGKQGS